MRSKMMAKRIAAKRPVKNGPAAAKTALGALPEWNLSDLYAGLDDPAIKSDLDRADADCVAFENAYKGKLADLARSPRPGCGARRGGAALRGDRRSHGAARLLCRAHSLPATPSIRRAPNSTATCRSG